MYVMPFENDHLTTKWGFVLLLNKYSDSQIDKKEYFVPAEDKEKYSEPKLPYS